MSEEDEVKVFRNETEEDYLDDLDPQDSSQLAEDKKDVVLEAELESRPLDSATPSAFSTVPPQPNQQFGQLPNFNPLNMMMTQSLLMGQFPAYPPMQLSPAYQMVQRMLSPGYSLQTLHNPMQIPYLLGLNQMNQMQQAQMRGFGLPIPPYNNQQYPQNMKNNKNVDNKVKAPQEPRHKRPMNCYFYYKKEYRLKLKEEEEFKNKQESELNAELAKRWNKLEQEEREKYIQMAKQARDEHKEKYPDWSAKENYGHNVKRKRKHNGDEKDKDKKCRARFGTENRSQWCKNCTIKKKCMYATGGSQIMKPDQPISTPSSVLTSIPDTLSPQVFSPESDRETVDSETEEECEEDDDPQLTNQAFIDMQNQEVLNRPI